jgi:hypothetical protein
MDDNNDSLLERGMSFAQDGHGKYVGSGEARREGRRGAVMERCGTVDAGVSCRRVL